MSNGMSLVPGSTTTKDFYGAHHASVYIKIWVLESKEISSGKYQNFHQTQKTNLSICKSTMRCFFRCLTLEKSKMFVWKSPYKLSCSTKNSSHQLQVDTKEINKFKWRLKGTTKNIPALSGLPLSSPSHVCPLALSKGCCPSWIPNPKWPGGQYPGKVVARQTHTRLK